MQRNCATKTIKEIPEMENEKKRGGGGQQLKNEMKSLNYMETKEEMEEA